MAGVAADLAEAVVEAEASVVLAEGIQAAVEHRAVGSESWKTNY
jgi:hypothetical protein